MGKHASAMRTLDRLMAIYARLKQPHNTTKALLSRVVLLLAAADPVSAQREFERHLGTADFAASPEGAAAEDMINAYSALRSGGGDWRGSCTPPPPRPQPRWTSRR